MTREEAKNLLPIIQAYAEGKTIEYSYDGEHWESTNTPSWDCNVMYRIKPEPKYRPFKTKEECWNEMHHHSYFGLLIRIDSGAYASIVKATSNAILLNNVGLCTFKDAVKYYKFIDGTPFGIKLPTNI